jgi:transposase
VRFVAWFVESLRDEEWRRIGINRSGEAVGAPAYDPEVLLALWLYGFMAGVRSSRKLEVACREQLPYIWLTAQQHPDHNTLWRFYKAHRQGMRHLFEVTVRTAVAAGLVDLAFQAVDGTKVEASASKRRTFDEKALRRLLERVEAAIADLEAQNKEDLEEETARIPAELTKNGALLERIREALDGLEAHPERRTVNLTDSDAKLMPSQGSIKPAYNAQAVTSPLVPEKTGNKPGRIITAVDVVTSPSDVGQLLPLLDSAAECTGQRAEVTVADAGYHSGRNLEGCSARAQVIVMSEGEDRKARHPYHKDRFVYEQETDSYVCPQGERLIFSGMKGRPGRPDARLYRAGIVCRTCPVQSACTRNPNGRTIAIGPTDGLLRRHRQWMTTAQARAWYVRRRHLAESTFGILKEQQRARRFHLRGLENVRAEWQLLAATLNLRTLARVLDRSRGWLNRRFQGLHRRSPTLRQGYVAA